jgi:aminoglycoside phosphotransferase (APT) family kinase protein
VPHPEWYSPPGAPGLPFGAIGYRRIDGQPLTAENPSALGRERTAAQLADFLVALHEVPTLRVEE